MVDRGTFLSYIWKYTLSIHAQTLYFPSPLMSQDLFKKANIICKQALIHIYIKLDYSRDNLLYFYLSELLFFNKNAQILFTGHPLVSVQEPETPL